MLIAIAHNAVPPNAREDERDVLVQAEAVCTAIQQLGHSHVLVPVSLDLQSVIDRLVQLRPDVVFNLVENLAGSDRVAALGVAAIEQTGLPITGCSSDALWISNHKTLAKHQLRAAALPTPTWYEPPAGSAATGTLFSSSNSPVPGSNQAVEQLGNGRFIVKPVFEHASLGMDESAIVHVNRADELAAAVEQRSRTLGQPCFAEQFVEGREFNVSLLVQGHDCEVLPIAEIDFSTFPPGTTRIVDYKAKWDPSSFAFHNTPRKFLDRRSEPDLYSGLEMLARRCWSAIQLDGHVRVDFRVDAQGNAWILEVNSNPCLSPDAGFQAALHQAGISFSEAIRRIVSAALTHPKPTRRLSSQHQVSTTMADRPPPPDASPPRAEVSNVQWRYEVVPTDARAVREIVASTGFFYPDEVAVAEELVQERLTRGASSGYSFVFAEREGRLVGYACFGAIACTRHSYDLYWIAVDPQCQGTGLGKTILRQSEERIKEAGGRRVYIETSNRPQYQSTRAFYERCGYTRDAVLAEFYGPGDDKVVYVKQVE